MFEKLRQKSIKNSIGIDTFLASIIEKDTYTLVRGRFPEALPKDMRFNSIIMLAALEHLPREEQLLLNDNFYQVLESKGKIMITVPSPLVDSILWILNKLKLIEGMSLEEHYGFKAKNTSTLFNPNQFRLLKHERFRLGLNNLFVFEKID